MPKTYKTTKKDFKLYKKEFKKWYKRFGLSHIEVIFTRDPDDNSFGWTTFDSEGMVANVALVINWDTIKPTKKMIKKTAFHECMEVFLFHLRNCATRRFMKEDEIDQEMHRVIRTLETAVFERED